MDLKVVRDFIDAINDLIQLLTDVKKIRINNRWYLNEYTSYTQKLIEKFAITIILRKFT